MSKNTTITYGMADDAWTRHEQHIRGLIAECQAKIILEAGAGAKPLLLPEEVAQGNLDYTLADAEATELAKGGAGYKQLVLNLEDSGDLPDDYYDFIFSRSVLEHVQNPAHFHTHLYTALKPGGRAFHFFSCLGALPMVANILLPEWIGGPILRWVQPSRRDEKEGKFPARYRWCTGPTRKNIARFETLGYQVLSYEGFFAHAYYKRLPLLDRLEQAKGRWLVKHPQPRFCVNAYLLLEKPKG